MHKFSNVLVTGGFGHIGSYLAERLIKEGKEVSICDIKDLPSYLNFMRDKLAFYDKIDVCKAELDNFFRKTKPEIVFHLAASLGVRNTVINPIKVLENNVMGTRNVLECCAKYDVKKIVFVSTSEVYGENSQEKFIESSPLIVKSTDSPRWTYAASKIIGEQYVTSYSKERGINYSIGRVFNSYGPRVGINGVQNVITLFVKNLIKNKPLSLYGDGTQKRSFCFVKDISNGLFYCGFKKNADNQIFNIGNNKEISINELARKLIHLSGKEAKVIHEKYYTEEIFRRCPSIEKAKELLGWKPEISLEHGLKITYDWYDRYGVI